MMVSYPNVKIREPLLSEFELFITNYSRAHQTPFRLPRTRAIKILLDRNKKYQELLRKLKQEEEQKEQPNVEQK
jgi:hypothetical protein